MEQQTQNNQNNYQNGNQQNNMQYNGQQQRNNTRFSQDRARPNQDRKYNQNQDRNQNQNQNQNQGQPQNRNRLNDRNQDRNRVQSESSYPKKNREQRIPDRNNEKGQSAAQYNTNAAYANGDNSNRYMKSNSNTVKTGDLSSKVIKTRHIETVEDIQADIERVEKDIQLEIKQIRAIKLGL